MLSSADNPTTEGRAEAFISYSTSKIQVEFEVVARRLRRTIVESVARDKYGVEGFRILRLLSTSGKMDEKQVCYVSSHGSCKNLILSADLETCHDGSKGCAATSRCTVGRLLDKHARSA